MICRRCNDEIVSDVGCRCSKMMPPREFQTLQLLEHNPQTGSFRHTSPPEKVSYPVEVSQPRYNTVGHDRLFDHGVDNC